LKFRIRRNERGEVELEVEVETEEFIERASSVATALAQLVGILQGGRHYPVELRKRIGLSDKVEIPEPKYLPVYEYIKSKGFPYEHSVDEVKERFADLIKRVSEVSGRPEAKAVHDLLTSAHRRLEREEGVKFTSRQVPTPDGLKTVYRAER